MDSYEPTYVPYFASRFGGTNDTNETNDGHNSPTLFPEEAAHSDDGIFNASTDPGLRDPLDSQKSTTKSVPMDISASGRTLSGSQRSEADKKTSEAEGRNSRLMHSPLRVSPAKSPLRAAQAKATSPLRKLNESFKGVLPKNNSDASPTRNQNATVDHPLNASIRHVHAGELSRVPSSLLSNGQVFLTCVPMVYNSEDNSWTSQGSIIVPPSIATDFCGFSIRPSDTTANVTTVDAETLESARKPRSTLRNSSVRKSNLSTGRKESFSSATRMDRQSSVRGTGGGAKGSGRKVEFSPDDEMDREDPDYDQSIGNWRAKNSSGKKTAEKKSSNAKFKTPARTSAAKSSGKKLRTPDFDDDVIESSPVKAEEMLPAATSSNKKAPVDPFAFDAEDAPGPRKHTYTRTPQPKSTKKTPTSSASIKDKDKSSGARKKPVVMEDEPDEDKSDVEDIDGPLEAKKASERKAKDAQEKASSNTKKDNGKVSSGNKKKTKVTGLEDSDEDEVVTRKAEEKSDSKPGSSLPAKYQDKKFSSLKESIAKKYEEEEKKYENEEEVKVDKGRRPSKVPAKSAVAQKRSVVEDVDEDVDEDDEGSEIIEAAKKPSPILARKTGRARAPSDTAKDLKAQEKKEKAEQDKDKAGKATVKGRKRTQPEDEDTASERATVESEGSSSRGVKKRASNVSNLEADSAVSSRESSLVGRKKNKEEAPAEEAKKGRKKSGSVGGKKAPQSDFVVAMSKSLTGEIRDRFDKVADQQGWEVHGDLADNATHLAVSLEDDKKRLTKRTVTFLKAVLRGVWIVDPQWLVTCATKEEKADGAKFEIPGAINQGAKNGPKRARESREKAEPKLFVGCNFFFKNVKKLDKDFREMIEMGGGKMLTEEPTKRKRPSKDRLFHASKDSLVGTCHYFIVDDDVKEGTLHPDVPSCAVIPGGWLSDSIECFQLKDVKEHEGGDSNEL
ncbi:hypothetical protein RvY_16415 [Ramazzottius varieornatus]|uniref:BRCT domain-containing protein n=1 Tax=Ramazzottius varieornatus TaxID=947166 RepID=A0A1D1VZM7_RAMVA|nr:hypothetical protein RvY_16415 [Ramazzottius varieornatus]